MRRVTRLFCQVLVLFSLLLISCGLGQAADPIPANPNVLFIVADDQRFDTIGALGNPEIRTPNLDALAKRGVAFRNAYCMGGMIAAVCAPSRTMIMTGRSLWRIPQPSTKTYDDSTLGSLFRQAGYATLFVGKKGNTFIAGNEAFETVIYQDDKTDGGRVAASKHCVSTAMAWLREQKPDRPFCIYLGPPVPHDPRVAPPEFMDMYDPAKITLSANFLPQHPFDNGELRIRDEMLAPHPRTPDVMKRHLADYYATISNFDQQLGRLFDALREAGQLDKTLVVFTSDQGLAVGGRHGLMGKQNLYEHFKSPLILAGPGIPQDKTSDALVYLFDLLPTVCNYAGITIPPQCEGQSLLPVLRGEKNKVRDWLLGAYRGSQRMIRDERWKLISYNAGGVKNVQLFDLSTDPDEVANLADKPEHTAERQRLEELLTEARKSFGDPSDFDGLGSTSFVRPPRKKNTP